MNYINRTSRLKLKNTKLNRYSVKYNKVEYTSLRHFVEHYGLVYSTVHRKLAEHIASLAKKQTFNENAEMLKTKFKLDTVSGSYNLIITIHNEVYI